MFNDFKHSAKKRIFEAILSLWAIEEMLPIFFRKLSFESNDTYIYHRVIDQSKEIRFFEPSNREYSFTVIVQGPIVEAKNLTLNVLFDFLRSQESSRVILSTWEDEETRNIEYKLKSFIDSGRLRILKSKKPETPGISNINLQIASVKSAFHAMREDKTKYALKVRSDQRYIIENPCSNMENYFLKFTGDTKVNKIIITSQNTFVYRNFGASDFIQFGNFDDIKNYWGCDFDYRNLSDLRFPSPKNMKQESENSICEIYLTRNYLNRIGYKFDDSLEGSLKVFSEVFIILDPIQIGLVWTKYSFGYAERNSLAENSPFLELTHRRWNMLHESGGEEFVQIEGQEISNR